AAIATGDFDGDGNVDLVVADLDGNKANVLLGIGDGAFEFQVDYQTGDGPNSVAVCNLNGDEWLDLAFANGRADTVSVLLGRAGGTFAPKVDYPAGQSPRQVHAGDLDGDDHEDLAIVSDGIVLLRGNGDGTLGSIERLSPAAVTSLLTSDVNRDGRLDVL